MMGYDLLRSPSSEVLRCSSLQLLLLLFSCTALLLPLPPSVRASDDADRLALLAFKSGVSSDNGWLYSWSNNNSNSSPHHCRWRGVTCSNSSSRVTTLDLGSLGLEGVVITGGPRGSLTYLQKLLLGNNLFHGVIPSGVGWQLPSLTHLDLSSNRLVGRIPPSLARCQQLLVIDLSGNKLHGDIPDELGSLSKLVVLYLARNKLTGSIPPSLLLLGGSNLSSLQQLDLSYNILTQLPPPSDPGLQMLSSSSSSSLLYLDLSSNALVGSVPPYLSVCRFHALETLDLSYNSLSGAIPPQISNLVNLRNLDLSNNNLSGGIPPSMGSNLTLLSELSLSANSLEGPIPPSLTNLSSLTVLDLSRNKLQGPLPPGLDRLTRLEFLQLSENRLQGSIPESLGSCRNLTYIDLSFNDLEGPVPTEGIFGTAITVSVYGNDKLCGGVPELQLPTCQPLLHNKGTNKKKNNKWPVIISVSLFGVLFLILFSGFLTVHRLRRDSKARLSVSPSMDPVHPKVSYIELLRATDDFSSDNLMGFGNYGSVYMGTMTDGEAVAVKVFNLENRGALKSFMSECEALRNIRHRNLVKILTVCSTTDSRGNDFKALVYEFMPNGSLEGWLHPESDGKIYAKRLNLTQRVNIAIDVAAALDYLHNQCIPTIVHCDLKPSNVLLDYNMIAHVGDFGLSKFLPMAMVATNAIKGAHFSNSVHIRGSIGYIPPEYGMGGSVSTHGDVFSYGMLLLELFTGIRPTNGLVLKDGLTLQKHVEVRQSKGFAHEIADPSLILNEDDENIAGGEMGGPYIAVVEQCLLSLFSIALSCVKESPRDRIKIEHVVSQMHQIREGLHLGTK